MTAFCAGRRVLRMLCRRNVGSSPPTSFLVFVARSVAIPFCKRDWRDTLVCFSWAYFYS